MVGSMVQAGPQQPRTRRGKFRRGAIFTAVGMAALGVVSIFVPLVPLTVAIVIGGVTGGAVASATGEDVKK